MEINRFGSKDYSMLQPPLKNGFLIFILGSIFLNSCAYNQYFIQATLPEGNNETVYLTKSGLPNIVDSTIVRNEEFQFKGKLEDPNFYRIEIKEKSGYLQFFLEGTDYQISAYQDSIWKSKIVTDSKEHKLQKELNQKLKPFVKRINESSKKATEFKKIQDTINHRLYLKENQAAAREMDLAKLGFVEENPASFISLFRFPYSSKNLKSSQKKSAFNSLSHRFIDHPKYQRIQIHLLEMDSILYNDRMAPNFSLLDEKGNTIRLIDFKSKWVLIDFWASWCAPCIEQFPKMQKLFSGTFDKSAFEVISISIDGNHDSWKKSLKANDLNNWISLIDENKKVQHRYGVNEIPHNFLLSPNNLIYGIDLSINEINKILRKNIK